MKESFAGSIYVCAEQITRQELKGLHEKMHCAFDMGGSGVMQMIRF